MKTTAVDIMHNALNIVTNFLIPIAFGLCLLYFFWGIVKYIKTGAGSEAAAKEGRRIMTWGIVGLFVAASIWGIVRFLRSELSIPDIQNVGKENVENVSEKISYPDHY